ncbi:MAG: phosphoenolpyruvate carboxylase, partial [Pseudomonadota bacterium]
MGITMDGTGHPAHDAASTKPDALYKRALQALDGLYPRVAALYQDVAGQYAERQSQAASDPLKNPIQGLSGRLAAAILSGEMSPDDVQKLVRFVVVRSAIWRAYRQADYVGSVDMAAHDQDLRELISQIAHDGEGKLKPFADFQRIFEREIYGLVLTAHPTFLLPRPLIPIFAQLVEFFGGATTMSDQDLADTLKALGGQTHGWTGGVTLDDEHELSIEALHHIQAAVTRFLAGLFAVAAELYPAQWTRLQPRPITLASWVGYDLDGRSDIRWSDTLRARLILQRHQLKNYATRVAAIADAMDQHAADLPATPIKLLASRLDYALRVVSDDLNSLPREADDTAAVEAFGQLLTRDHDIRLTSHDELLNLLHQAIDGLTAPDWDADTILHALVGLRA